MLLTLLPLAGWAQNVSNIGIQLSNTLTKVYGNPDPTTLESTDFVIISDVGESGLTTDDLKEYLTFKRKLGQEGETANQSYEWEVTVSEDFATDHVGYAIVATNTGRITINPRPLSSTMLAAITETYTYDGNQKKPTPTVSYQNGDETVTLTAGEDFNYVYGDNVNAGEDAGSVTIEAATNTNYANPVANDDPVTFDIAKLALTSLTVEAIADQTYNLVAVTPTTLTITSTVDSKLYTLTADDYETEYANNTNVGVATVTISAAEDGNFTFANKTANFNIVAKNLDSEEIVISDIENKTYTGSAINPEGVTVTWGEAPITNLVDIVFTNNINVGKAVVTITPKSTNNPQNYTGSKTKTFNIVPPSIAGATVQIAEGEDLVYDGKAKTPALVVTIGEHALVLGTEYEIVEGSWENNVNAGTASVKIKGLGNYDAVDTKGDPIEKEVEFTITALALKLTATDNVEQYYGVSPLDKFGYAHNVVEGELLKVLGGKITYTIQQKNGDEWEGYAGDWDELEEGSGKYRYVATWSAKLEPLGEEALAAAIEAGTYDPTLYDTQAQIDARANYTLTQAGNVPGAIIINPATLTIVPRNASRRYGSADPDEYAYDVYVGDAEDQIEFEGEFDDGHEPVLVRAEGDDADKYTISVKNAKVGVNETTADNVVKATGYTVVCQTGTFTITKFPITLTANNQTIVYGSEPNTETLYNSYVKTVVNGEETYDPNKVTVTFSPVQTGNGDPIDRSELDLVLTWNEETNVLTPDLGENCKNYEIKKQNTGTVTIVNGNTIMMVRLDVNENDLTETPIASLLSSYHEKDVNYVIKAKATTTLDAFRKMYAQRWYALVLPFNTTVREISKAFGYAVVDIFDKASSNTTDVDFRLHMGTINANEPFILKIDADRDLYTNPVTFNGVTIDYDANPAVSAAQGKVQFIGVWDGKKGFTGHEYVFALGTGKVSGTSSNSYIPPMSAYIHMDEQMDGMSNAPIFNIEEPDGSTTSISVVDFAKDGSVLSNEGWYTVNGVKLSAAPTEKGVYINNGKKVVLK